MTTTKGNLREALALWIPSGTEDPTETLENFLVCRSALDDFLDGHLSSDDYLEILAGYGVDMDDYSEITDGNLSILEFG